MLLFEVIVVTVIANNVITSSTIVIVIALNLKYSLSLQTPYSVRMHNYGYS